MPLLHASAERTIPAPAAAVYSLLADYRDGHPRILSPDEGRWSRRASRNQNLAECSLSLIQTRAP
jgi:hypothetical protein